MIFAGQGWALLHFAECAASWTELDTASWFPPGLPCQLLDAGLLCAHFLSGGGYIYGRHARPICGGGGGDGGGGACAPWREKVG